MKSSLFAHGLLNSDIFFRPLSYSFSYLKIKLLDIHNLSTLSPLLAYICISLTPRCRIISDHAPIMFWKNQCADPSAPHVTLANKDPKTTRSQMGVDQQ